MWRGGLVWSGGGVHYSLCLFGCGLLLGFDLAGHLVLLPRRLLDTMEVCGVRRRTVVHLVGLGASAHVRIEAVSLLTNDALHLAKLARLLSDTHDCGSVLRSRTLRRDNFLVEPEDKVPRFRAAKQSARAPCRLFYSGTAQRQSRRDGGSWLSSGTRSPAGRQRRGSPGRVQLDAPTAAASSHVQPLCSLDSRTRCTLIRFARPMIGSQSLRGAFRSLPSRL